MLMINCPCCGARSEEEFVCAGQAHIERPADPAHTTDAEWSAYLFERKNTRGIHLERWCHRFGCGSWFNLARDTVGHTIVAVYPMGERPPGDLES